MKEFKGFLVGVVEEASATTNEFSMLVGESVPEIWLRNISILQVVIHDEALVKVLFVDCYLEAKLLASVDGQESKIVSENLTPMVIDVDGLYDFSCCSLVVILLCQSLFSVSVWIGVHPDM